MHQLHFPQTRDTQIRDVVRKLQLLYQMNLSKSFPVCSYADTNFQNSLRRRHCSNGNSRQ